MTIIVADTTAGLPLGLFKEKGIPVVPQIVIFGEDSYRDDNELDTATFLQKLKAASKLPKTAAPPPALYYPIFEEARKRKESVVVIAPSAKVSGTVQAASVAAQDFPDLDVRVIDSLTVAGDLGSLVLMAHEWAREGLPIDTIIDNLKDKIRRSRTFFLVDTLEYLQKGGRIGGAKALLGEMLKIKPILTVRDGQVSPYEQQRTKKRALARLVEIVEEQCPKNAESHLCVMQADALETAQTLATELKTRTGIEDIPIYELPPAIVVHGGPGVLAVGFFT